MGVPVSRYLYKDRRAAGRRDVGTDLVDGSVEKRH